MTQKLGASGGLIVRGEDQLFSFKGVLASQTNGAISGADGYFDSPAVPAGEFWKVTNVVTADTVGATTEHRYVARHDGTNVIFYTSRVAYAIGEYSVWGGELWLDPGDVIRIEYYGSGAADWAWLNITGYRMTLET